MNPTWDQLVESDPLVAFSWYLSGRKNVLLGIGREIVAELDAGFAGSTVDMGRVDRAESLAWLWTLGAYEVVRTMSQAQACFSDRVQTPMAAMKAALAGVRMPAAKMEKPRRNEPVTSNRSPAMPDIANRDLLVGDPAGSMTSARALIQQFERFVSNIAPSDVLRSHAASYATSGPTMR